jgi:hypothetical protein
MVSISFFCTWKNQKKRHAGAAKVLMSSNGVSKRTLKTYFHNYLVNPQKVLQYNDTNNFLPSP